MATNADGVEMAKAVVETIKRAVDPLRARITALEQRLGTVESLPQLKWCGTFTPGMDYGEANLCTHAGGLWLATKQTDTTPGTVNAAWRLIVKSGRAT